MKKRIISESINIRINVGNYQHIEIVKQAQEEISYKDESERISLENLLTNDLINSVVRSMREIPSRLGKGVAEAQELEEQISSSIPKWLNENPPNIINETKKKLTKVSSDQKENKDKCVNEILDLDNGAEKKIAIKNESDSHKSSSDSDSKEFDYFDEKVKEFERMGIDVNSLPSVEDEKESVSDNSNIVDDEFGIFDF